jgi:hypothetical protein
MRNIVLLVLPLSVAGCSTTLPRGQLTPVAVAGPATVEQPGQLVGRPFVDFRFVDRNGKPGNFSNELGDYTVLAFLSGNTDGDQMTLDKLQTLLEDSSTDDNVDVVGVVVGPPGVTVNVRGPLGAAWYVADNGQLHRAYGATKGDWLYVIGPSHRIVMAAPAGHATELASVFRGAVDVLSRQRVAEAFANSDEIVRTGPRPME